VTFVAPIGLGGGRTVQLNPPHDSANGPLDPPNTAVLKFPTAKQSVTRLAHDTESKELYGDPLGVGLNWPVQLVPSHPSASVE